MMHRQQHLLERLLMLGVVVCLGLSFVSRSHGQEQVQQKKAIADAETADAEAADTEAADTEAADTEAADTEAAETADAEEGETAEAGEAGGAAKEEKAAPNPLGNLIRNIFKKTTPVNPPDEPAHDHGDEASEEKEEPVNGDKTARDHIDERAPHIREQTRLLSLAKRKIEEGDWETAVDAIQRLVDRQENSVSRVDEQRFLSVRQQAHDLLGTAPAEVLDVYRTKFGGQARQLLEKARQSGAINDYITVTDHFFHTFAGYDAANWLATLKYDQGHLSVSAHWYLRLIQADAPCVHDPMWRLHAMHAVQMAGLEDQLESREKFSATNFTGEPIAKLDLPTIDDEPFAPDAWTKQVATTQQQLELGTDWLTLYGNASRSARFEEGTPVLIERWSQPLTENSDLKRQLGFLVDDIRTNNRATVPTFQSACIDGKVAYRTYEGIRVVDAATGEELWSALDPWSAARVMQGTLGTPNHFVKSDNATHQTFNDYTGNSYDSHPLGSLLYRNGVYGSISSDGERVYAISKSAILSRYQGYYWGNSPEQNDQLKRDWTSNQIVAYDLETGRQRWIAGGRAMGEAFDSPLAGTFFLGAPTPAGSKIYAVGEKDNEIRLYAMDAISGEPLWSQLLAYAEVKIEQDLGRRWWVSQPTVDRGLIICPTTVGWLVAIDQVSHDIVWAYRYEKPNTENRSRYNRGYSLQSLGQLDSLWCASAPLMSDDCVVFAPTEHQQLVCLNLKDGSRKWGRDVERGDSMYPIGIHDGCVVVVGKSSVKGIRLENGTQRWQVSYDENFILCGRGLLTETTLVVPIAQGLDEAQLWQLDLASAASSTPKISKSFLSGPPRDAIGNLYLHAGLLLSLTPASLVAFEQLETVEEFIASANQSDHQLVAAGLKQAELRLLERDYSATLAALDKIADEPKSEREEEQHHAMTFDTLLSIVKKDWKANDQEFERLTTIATSSGEMATLKKLDAYRKIQRGELVPAWRSLLELSNSPPGAMMKDFDDARLDIRSDVWLAHQLEVIWDAVDEEQREQLEESLERHLESEYADEEIERFTFLVEVLPFHPTADDARIALAHDAISRNDFAAAEYYVKQLEDVNKPGVVELRIGFAGLLAELDLVLDAKALLEELAESDIVHGDESAETHQAQIQAAINDLGVNAEELPSFAASWRDVPEYEIRRLGGHYSYETIRAANLRDSLLPFYRSHRFVFRQSKSRLLVSDTDDAVYWSVPLRTKSGISQSDQLPVIPIGHRAITMHAGVAHCLSFPERRVVWSQPIELPTSSSSYNRGTSRIDPNQLMRARHISSKYNINSQVQWLGMLAEATPTSVVYHGRRQLYCLDSLTGEIRWIRSRVPRNTVVFGDEDYLVMSTPARNDAFVVNATSGVRVETKRLSVLLSRAIATQGRHLVTVENTSSSSILGLASDSTKFSLVDPISNETVWETKVDRDSFAGLTENTLVLISPDNDVSTFELKSGKEASVGKLPKDSLKTFTEAFVVEDDQNVYLFVNGKRRYSYMSIHSTRVNGLVAALSKKDEKLAWTKDIKDMHFVLDHYRENPLALFVYRNGISKEGVYYQQIKIRALDKLTGDEVIKFDGAMNSSPMAIDLDLANQVVDIRSYNERLRIQPVRQLAQSPEAGEPTTNEASETDGAEKEEVEPARKAPEARRQPPAPPEPKTPLPAESDDAQDSPFEE